MADIEIKKYRGHIRNWETLCQELNIDPLLPREILEEKILIEAYKKWEHNMGLYLEGMYSFALWDNNSNKLFCLRDPFGTKGFYYYVDSKNNLLYGTMIKDILKEPTFKKELNIDMLQLYLTFTYVAGEDTFFKGLKKLLPGHYLVYENNKVTIERYFKAEFYPDETKNLDYWADQINTTLKTILSEVKTKDEYAESFLSGGVDSSYIFGASDLINANSCGYKEERFDESKLAEETAKILGKNINKCIIEPEDYFKIVPWVMKNMEQPLADASAIAFALGCLETAKHTKICYSGEGSDEFFGGYNIYRNAEKYAENMEEFYVGNTNIMKEDEKKRILKKYNPDILPINLLKPIYEKNRHLDPLSRMTDIDIQLWLEGDIFFNIDKMSEASNLEIRMPLVDRRIFDIASKIPSKYKISEEHNKLALRTAARTILPEEVAFRKKLGFIVPIRIWLADEKYNKDVVEKFNSNNAAKFFNLEEINNIFIDYINGNSDNWRKVWTIYTFLVWYEQYFK